MKLHQLSRLAAAVLVIASANSALNAGDKYDLMADGYMNRYETGRNKTARSGNYSPSNDPLAPNQDAFSAINRGASASQKRSAYSPSKPKGATPQSSPVKKSVKK